MMRFVYRFEALGEKTKVLYGLARVSASASIRLKTVQDIVKRAT
jgi:hypothetical protein